MQNADNARVLVEALQALPSHQRAALILVYLEDMSGIQAAQALGVSVKAIERLLFRGRGSLRARLDAANLGSVS